MLGLPAGTFVHVNLMEKLKGLEMMFLASVRRYCRNEFSLFKSSQTEEGETKPSVLCTG